MRSIFCRVDDKHIPLYRIMWVSELPHFCGEEDCVREGQYEVRLELDESVWANREERDEVITALENWRGGDDLDFDELDDLDEELNNDDPDQEPDW